MNGTVETRIYYLKSISNRYSDIEELFLRNESYYNLEINIIRTKGILMSDYRIKIKGESDSIDKLENSCIIDIKKYKV